MKKINKIFFIELAFEVMRDFLDKYWIKTKLDDVGNLLSSMMLFSDKNDKARTFDPAIWCEWMDSVKKIKAREKTACLSDFTVIRLTEEEVFNVIMDFLYNYEKIDNSKEIMTLIEYIETIKFVNGVVVSTNSASKDWIDSINKITSEDFEIPYCKFVLTK